MVKIKICGLTCLEDAKAAVELGADFIGFMFAPSPRCVAPEQAWVIIDNLPRDVQTVGVFADEPAERVKEIADHCHLDWLQFHGDETPGYCGQFQQKVIKSVRVKDLFSLQNLGGYKVEAFLLDAYSEAALGGTGQVFDWKIATSAQRYGKIFLAGGLNAENVTEAVKTVKPYAVDVSSGVESAPGRKDINKMRAFIEACRKIDSVS